MNKYFQVVTSARGRQGAELERAQEGQFICLEEVRFGQSGRGNRTCKDLVAGRNLVSQRNSKEATVGGGSRGCRAWACLGR